MLKRAGKAVGQRFGGNRDGLLIAGLLGIGAVGAGSAILDRQGPYTDLQEFALGDPNAIRYTMGAMIRTGISGDHNIYGHGGYYYGSPTSITNPPPNIYTPPGTGRTTPVPGSIVFGQRNLRHG